MTRLAVGPLLVAVKMTGVLLLCPGAAVAVPDLRQGRPAGLLTVYPDDARRNLFYYPPGDLAIATREDGAPDVHLLHARYTGSVINRDQGTAVLRSIFSVRVALSGPTPSQLADARLRLTVDTGGPVELRPLPIRRLESAIVYAPVAPAGSDASGASGPDPQNPSPQSMPSGHFESSETASAPGNGYWSERVYTFRLEPEDAQLLSTALEHGQVVMSIGYAFLADGIGPDRPLQELSGSPALVSALQNAIAKSTPPHDGQPDEATPVPHVVRAGALAVTANLAQWPSIVSHIDINDSAPPGYAALDVYCYDFNQGVESLLYEKQIQIEASGVGGRPVTMTASFSRSQPDLYARSLRFPVAVRLDRPYRFRVVEIAQDGSSRTTTWKEQASWTDLLDVTTQGDRR
jgi:hypothetical protein